MPGPRTVAVFGSSEPQPGSDLYQAARETGRLLASRGYRVITGGYGGVMEGASRGAVEAGGSTVGVLCDIFTGRTANPYVQEEVHTRDLLERTRILVERAGAYVILAGKAGTLAELALVWALHRAGCLDPRPVVLLGDGWNRLLLSLEQEQMLDPEQSNITRVASSPREAMALLEQALEG